MKVRDFFSRHAPTLVDFARVVKNGQIEPTTLRRTFAQPGLHRFIRDRFKDRGGVFFEVGANNGLTQSNTAYLERYLGWTGVLVEAVPHKYVECKRNRPRSLVRHAALVSTEYDKDFVPIHYSDLMSVSETVSPEMRETHLSAGEKFIGTDSELSGEVFYAPARTVTALLEECGVTQIDLFSLDVEGAELEVLKGIDFSIIRPRNFIIEVRDIDSVAALLQTEGYHLDQKLTHHDYLFVAD